MRVGSATPRKVDVRVIAATNKDLEIEVRQGEFRSDLFFGSGRSTSAFPALRERRNDIPIFVETFARQIAEKNRLTFAGFTREAIELLKNYDWPGNVQGAPQRHRSMLVIERGKQIDAEDVRRYLRNLREDGRNLPVYARRVPNRRSGSSFTAPCSR